MAPSVGIGIGITARSVQATGGTNPAPPPAPAAAPAPLDTEDGGLFLADTGFEPDYDETFLREYQIEGDATWREMYRPVYGTDDALKIKVAGYRTEAGVDHSGDSPGRVRFRDTVDGVAQTPTDWIDFTCTSTTAASQSSFDPFGDGSIVTTFDTSYDCVTCPTDLNTLYVVAPSGLTIDSTTPAPTTTSSGRKVHGSGVDVPALAHPFVEKNGVGSNFNGALQVSFPVTVQPGSIFVQSRGDASAVNNNLNSPNRKMLRIVVVDERPPAGLMAPSVYPRSNSFLGSTRLARTMIHESVPDLNRLPTVDAPTTLGDPATTTTPSISRFGGPFDRGTNATRAVYPTTQTEPYHRETARDLMAACWRMMNTNQPTAIREKYLKRLCQRMIDHVEHSALAGHNYWWEAPVAVAGVAMGITEWVGARRNWITPPSYDGLYGPGSVMQNPESDEDTGRFGKFADLGATTPALQEIYPAQQDSIVYSGCLISRTITFTPSSADQAPIIDGVTDNGDGTWNIPANRGFLGERSFRSAIRVMDARPTTAGTDASNLGSAVFANVPRSGTNYRDHWTDGSNDVTKVSTYDWQHMAEASNNALFFLLLGLLDYSSVRYLLETAEDYMGCTEEWILTLTQYGSYNGNPIYATYEPQGLQVLSADVMAPVWWSEHDAAVASGGLYASKSAPGKLDRTRFALADLNNEADIGVTLLGHPVEDGRSPIDKWEVRVDGGTAEEVPWPHLDREYTITSSGIASHTVEVRMHNAEGWGPWSEPKTIEVAEVPLILFEPGAVANPAPGWPSQWNAFDNPPRIIAGNPVSGLSNSLRVHGPSTLYDECAARWGAAPLTDHVSVRARLRGPNYTHTTGAGQDRHGLIICGDGDDTNFSGYAIEIHHPDYFNWRVMRYVNGSYAGNLGTATPPSDFAGEEEYYVEVQREPGGDIDVWIWRVGDDRPATPTISGSDGSPLGQGWIGVYNASRTAAEYVDVRWMQAEVNVLRAQDYEGVEAVPAAFTSGDWSVAPGGDGELDVTINSLPSANGAEISDIEYQLNSNGVWLSAGTTGNFTISGLVAGASYDVELRGVNYVGAGAAGDTQTASAGTPIVPLTDGFTEDYSHAVGATRVSDEPDGTTAFSGRVDLTRSAGERGVIWEMGGATLGVGVHIYDDAGTDRIQLVVGGTGGDVIEVAAPTGSFLLEWSVTPSGDIKLGIDGAVEATGTTSASDVIGANTGGAGYADANYAGGGASGDGLNQTFAGTFDTDVSIFEGETF